MKGLLFLAIVLSFSTYVFAQNNCTQATDCKGCTMLLGCGWCAATQLCLAGNAGKTGPQAGYCYNSWHQGAGSCPSCDGFSDCRSCSVWGQDCVWCDLPTGGACRALGTTLCPTVTACPCEELSTCSECVTEPSCNWCTGNGTCMRDTNTAKCNGVKVTNGTCPCSLFTSCDSCRNGFGCNWCDDTGTCEPVGRQDCQIAHSTCNTYCKNNGPTCATCRGIEGCIWCGDTNTCVDEDTAVCMPAHSCPNCAGHEFCGSCIEETGCSWCENPDAKPRCQPTAQATCTVAPTCATFCGQFDSCTLCDQIGGCAWCDEGSGYCADTMGSCAYLTTTCAPVPITKPTKCKSFDGGSFVGGMFLVIGLLILGVGAYMFYRYKTGQKLLYQELK